MRSPAPDVSVVTAGHDVADARLHREVRALRAAGLAVELLGLGDAAGAPGGVTSCRTWPRATSPWRRVLHALVLPWRASGRVLLTLDPDLVAPALLAARARRRRLVVDVHEDYVALARDRGWAVGAARLGALGVVRLATWLAGRADAVAVADHHLPPHAARRRLVLPNLPDLGLLPSPSEPGSTPRALYVGDVRTSRGLPAMLAAVEAAPAWQLDVVGQVAPGDADWLRRWRAASPAADRVRFHGRLAPAEAWRLAEGAWLGLCLLDDTPAFRDAMPSKAYEYLACGLPLLVTPLPRLEALVTESGAGVVVRDAVDASVRLEYWSTSPEDLHALRRAARSFAAARLAGPSPYDAFAGAVRALVESPRPPSRRRIEEPA